MEAKELLGHARDLLKRRSGSTAGLWPRASALLARQALEAALDDFWRDKGIDLARCSSRAQLICLRTYYPDKDAARHAYQIWGALSRACHHHSYELAPTAGELEGWIAGVDQFRQGGFTQQPPGTDSA